MPIRKKWTKLTPKNIKKVPKSPGVYELTSRNKKAPIDIGKSENLQRRLKEKKKLRKTATHFRFEFPSMLGTATESEAKHSKKFQKKHGHKPKQTKRSPKNILDALFNL